MKIKVRKNGIEVGQVEHPYPPKPKASLEPEAPTDLPPPPHIGQPVGPPPPQAEVPSTFEGLVELARKVSGSPPPYSEKALIFAQLAQAMATNRLADLLEELVVFAGARDGDIADEKVKLIDVLESSIVNGVLGLKEELAPSMDSMGDVISAAVDAANVASTGEKR